jgi:hypothetical protein
MKALPITVKPLEELYPLVAMRNDIQQLGEDGASQQRVNLVERQVEATDRIVRHQPDHLRYHVYR